MKLTMKRVVLAVAIVGSAALIGMEPRQSSAAYDAQQVAKVLSAFKLGPKNSSPVVRHGTHLCSAHEHCGTGHLCCSGHCKAVSVC